MSGSSAASRARSTAREAAALPLTAITAWEMLFDRLDIRRPVPGAAAAVLIIGGAGGVGSMAVQLARQLTELTVIATASRPETAGLGADARARIMSSTTRGRWRRRSRRCGLGAPVLRVLDHPHRRASRRDREADRAAGALRPDRRPGAARSAPLKSKSVSIHWELMFTRPIFGTADMHEQHAPGRGGAAGRRRPVRTTLAERLSPITAANLRRAHALIEGGWSHGKLVLEGFGGLRWWRG